MNSEKTATITFLKKVRIELLQILIPAGIIVSLILVIEKFNGPVKDLKTPFWLITKWGLVTALVLLLVRYAIFLIKTMPKLMRILATSRKKLSKHPPLTLEFILCLILNQNEQEYIIDHLEHKYYKWLSRYGRGRAWMLYLKEAITYLRPKLIMLSYRALKFLTKIGVIGLITEWIRRKTR